MSILSRPPSVDRRRSPARRPQALAWLAAALVVCGCTDFPDAVEDATLGMHDAGSEDSEVADGRLLDGATADARVPDDAGDARASDGASGDGRPPAPDAGPVDAEPPDPDAGDAELDMTEGAPDADSTQDVPDLPDQGPDAGDQDAGDPDAADQDPDAEPDAGDQDPDAADMDPDAADILDPDAGDPDAADQDPDAEPDAGDQDPDAADMDPDAGDPDAADMDPDGPSIAESCPSVDWDPDLVLWALTDDGLHGFDYLPALRGAGPPEPVASVAWPEPGLRLTDFRLLPSRVHALALAESDDLDAAASLYRVDLAAAEVTTPGFRVAAARVFDPLTVLEVRPGGDEAVVGWPDGEGLQVAVLDVAEGTRRDLNPEADGTQNAQVPVRALWSARRGPLVAATAAGLVKLAEVGADPTSLVEDPAVTVVAVHPEGRFAFAAVGDRVGRFDLVGGLDGEPALAPEFLNLLVPFDRAATVSVLALAPVADDPGAVFAAVAVDDVRIDLVRLDVAENTADEARTLHAGAPLPPIWHLAAEDEGRLLFSAAGGAAVVRVVPVAGELGEVEVALPAPIRRLRVPTHAIAELCDGRDEDCDGVADDAFEVGGGCQRPGICGAGVYVCDGPYRARCETAVQPEPIDVCNGLDDDCDGERDEDPEYVGPFRLDEDDAPAPRVGQASGFILAADPEGGSAYAAAWISGQLIRFARFAADGQRMAAPVDLLEGAPAGVLRPPSVAWNGAQYAVVWVDDGRAQLRRLSWNGAHLDETPVSLGDASDAWVFWDGERWVAFRTLDAGGARRTDFRVNTIPALGDPDPERVFRGALDVRGAPRGLIAVAAGTRAYVAGHWRSSNYTGVLAWAPENPEMSGIGGEIWSLAFNARANLIGRFQGVPPELATAPVGGPDQLRPVSLRAGERPALAGRSEDPPRWGVALRRGGALLLGEYTPTGERATPLAAATIPIGEVADAVSLTWLADDRYLLVHGWREFAAGDHESVFGFVRPACPPP